MAEQTPPPEGIKIAMGWHDEDAPRPAPVDVAPTPVVRPGPDALRDGRIDTYRDRERRRAARALDRYIESMFTSPADVPQLLGIGANREAAGRFVEQVGDYVLARLGERAAAGGDVPADPHGPHPHEGSGGRCLDCPECMTRDGA